MEKFKTIKNNSKAEIVEKKSKFIAHIFYVETLEEADKYIKEINKSLSQFKRIKELIITTEELEKTTTKKVKRFKEIEKILN